MNDLSFIFLLNVRRLHQYVNIFVELPVKLSFDVAAAIAGAEPLNENHPPSIDHVSFIARRETVRGAAPPNQLDSMVLSVYPDEPRIIRLHIDFVASSRTTLT